MGSSSSGLLWEPLLQALSFLKAQEGPQGPPGGLEGYAGGWILNRIATARHPVFVRCCCRCSCCGCYAVALI